MIITISGNAGSGKSTIAGKLSEKLKLKSYDIGSIRRQKAKELGMTLEDYNKLGETDSSTDREVDEYQKKLGETEDNFIIQGRTSFLFIPNSIKIFIHVDPEIGAKRIWGSIQRNPQKRNEGRIDSLEDVKKSIANRIKSDKKRYRKYYKIDVYDPRHYDFVVDTSNMNSEEATEEISRYIEHNKS